MTKKEKQFIMEMQLRAGIIKNKPILNEGEDVDPSVQGRFLSDKPETPQERARKLLAKVSSHNVPVKKELDAATKAKIQHLKNLAAGKEQFISAMKAKSKQELARIPTPKIDRYPSKMEKLKDKLKGFAPPGKSYTSPEEKEEARGKFQSHAYLKQMVRDDPETEDKPESKEKEKERTNEDSPYPLYDPNPLGVNQPDDNMLEPGWDEDEGGDVDITHIDEVDEEIDLPSLLKELSDEDNIDVNNPEIHRRVLADLNPDDPYDQEKVWQLYNKHMAQYKAEHPDDN